jgi:hypothetical protein
MASGSSYNKTLACILFGRRSPFGCRLSVCTTSPGVTVASIGWPGGILGARASSVSFSSLGTFSSALDRPDECSVPGRNLHVLRLANCETTALLAMPTGVCILTLRSRLTAGHQGARSGGAQWSIRRRRNGYYHDLKPTLAGLLP